MDMLYRTTRHTTFAAETQGGMWAFHIAPAVFGRCPMLLPQLRSPVEGKGTGQLPCGQERRRGEGVGYSVVLSPNVPDARGELGDKGDLPTHPGNEVVARLAHSVCQRLVINEVARKCHK